MPIFAWATSYNANYFVVAANQPTYISFVKSSTKITLTFFHNTVFRSTDQRVFTDQ